MSGFAVDVLVERGDENRSTGSRFQLNAKFASGPGITIVFGPSGSGKSTLLLAILGALRPSGGRIEAGGRVLFDSDAGLSLAVRRRRVGMVFQDALLFPHLDAAGNVAFAARGAGRNEIARRFLDRVGAGSLSGRRPHELSGGQRQRVALARALAAEPTALLLDEPFSSLDGPSRESLGELLVELQNETGIPFLHVTHDPAEALLLGHRLVLLRDGRVEQEGSPADVLTRPASLAAARAVGTENVYSATVVGHVPEDGCTEVEIDGTRVQTGTMELPPGATVALGVRAEDILLSLEPLHQTSARNVIRGTVREVRERGRSREILVTTPAPFRVIVTPASVRELGLAPRRDVWLLVKAAAIHRLT